MRSVFLWVCSPLVLFFSISVAQDLDVDPNGFSGEADEASADTTVLVAPDPAIETAADSLPPVPVDSLVVFDSSNDAGGHIDLYWTISLDDALGSGKVIGYSVLRGDSASGHFVTLAILGPGTDRFIDSNAPIGSEFYYKIRTIDSQGRSSDSRVSGPVTSHGQWFDATKASVLGAVLVLAVFLLLTRSLTMEELWTLPAIRSVHELLERQHQGPLFYVPGTGGMAEMASLASLTLLDQVRSFPQVKDSGLKIYVGDPLVFAACSEVMEEEDNIELIYLCPDKTIFSVAFTGEILRERPGVNLMIGSTADETLLLSEAGSRGASVQVAGTDVVNQIPFLVATCDLTLIGEELYLTGPQFSVGGFRAAILLQDRLKVLVWILILLGIIGARLRWDWFISLFSTGVH